MVKITTVGGKTVDRPFNPSQTVSQYLASAGITPGRTATISVNEKDAALDTVVAEDGSVIVVAPKVANGQKADRMN